MFLTSRQKTNIILIAVNLFILIILILTFASYSYSTEKRIKGMDAKIDEGISKTQDQIKNQLDDEIFPAIGQIGLVSYWSFDRAESLNDMEGSNNLIAGGNAKHTSIDCLNGWCYNFTGKSSADRLAGNATVYGDFTISIWFKNGTSEYYQTLISGWNNNRSNFIQIDSTGRGIYAYMVNSTGGSQYIGTSSYVLSFPDAWQHIAISVNSTNSIVYWNGINVKTSRISGAIAVPNVDFTELIDEMRIGVRSDPDMAYHFNGTIDEVKIWNRALAPPEIRILAMQK